MQRITLLISTVLCILLLSGCQTWTKVQTGEELKADEQAFTIRSPANWVRHTLDNSDVKLTKDGPTLQWIIVQQVAAEDAFTAIEKTATEQMLITELAEYYLANLKKKNEGLRIEMANTRPAQVDNYDAFRMELRMTTNKGLIYNILVYGFYADSSFYSLFYRAPDIYYYQQELPDFEELVMSMRVN